MSNLHETEAIYVGELGIDDIAPIYHLGEGLFTSDLYPSLVNESQIIEDKYPI